MAACSEVHVFGASPNGYFSPIPPQQPLDGLIGALVNDQWDKPIQALTLLVDWLDLGGGEGVFTIDHPHTTPTKEELLVVVRAIALHARHGRASEVQLSTQVIYDIAINELGLSAIQTDGVVGLDDLRFDLFRLFPPEVPLSYELEKGIFNGFSNAFELENVGRAGSSSSVILTLRDRTDALYYAKLSFVCAPPSNDCIPSLEVEAMLAAKTTELAKTNPLILPYHAAFRVSFERMRAWLHNQSCRRGIIMQARANLSSVFEELDRSGEMVSNTLRVVVSPSAGISLYDFIERWQGSPSALAFSLATHVFDVFVGCEKLIEQGVRHNDLLAGNVYVDGDRVRIMDWDWATFTQGDHACDFGGNCLADRFPGIDSRSRDVRYEVFPLLASLLRFAGDAWWFAAIKRCILELFPGRLMSLDDTAKEDKETQGGDLFRLCPTSKSRVGIFDCERSAHDDDGIMSFQDMKAKWSELIQSLRPTILPFPEREPPLTLHADEVMSPATPPAKKPRHPCVGYSCDRLLEGRP
jgi:hypothetical protein